MENRESLSKDFLPEDLQNCFLSPENKTDFKQTMGKIIDMCVDFKTREKVLKDADFEEIMNRFNESLPTDPMNLHALINMFKK